MAFQLDNAGNDREADQLDQYFIDLPPEDLAHVNSIRLEKYGTDDWCFDSLKFYYKDNPLFAWSAWGPSQPRVAYVPAHPTSGPIWLRDAPGSYARFTNASTSHESAPWGNPRLELRTCSIGAQGTRDAVYLAVTHDGITDTVLIPSGGLDGSGSVFSLPFTRLAPVATVERVGVRTTGSDTVCIDWMRLVDDAPIVIGMPIQTMWEDTTDREVGTRPFYYDVWDRRCTGVSCNSTSRMGFDLIWDARSVACATALDNTCNNADEDCDGTQDEDYKGPLLSCGQGSCYREVLETCSNGQKSTCVSGLAVAEVPSNSIDDDCDGSVDVFCGDSFVSGADVCPPKCLRTCETKRCGDDPSDGCGGSCNGLCAGQPNCSTDLDCGIGEWCDPVGGQAFGTSGSHCAKQDCLLHRNDPNYCGYAGALCGPVCLAAACAPSCGDRECGTNPGDGCGGSCGTCSEREVCVGAGYCAFPIALTSAATISGAAPIGEDHVKPSVSLSDPTASLQGDFAVSNGFATYRLPIEAPPGRGVVEPAVALAYSSGAPGSAVGYGWHVEGTSNIHRCTGGPGSKLNRPNRIQLKPGDPYCLDGKPLIATSELPPQAGMGFVEYRIAGVENTRVMAVGFDAWGPRFFTVEDGTGRTMVYGSTADSSDFQNAPDINDLQSTGAKVTWGLSETRDVHGNFMRFSYEVEQYRKGQVLANGASQVVVDTTARYLKAIAYTGTQCASGATECANLDPDRAIILDYERLQPDQGVEAAPKISPRHGAPRLLRKVGVVVRDTTVREYKLTHTTQRRGHRLDGVTVCHPRGTGETCSAPTTFSYDETGDKLFEGEATLGSFPPMLAHAFLWLYTLDADGDGLTDVLHRRRHATEPVAGSRILEDRWVLKLSRRRSDGTMFAEEREVSLGRVRDTKEPGRVLDLSRKDFITPVDVNNDGRDDLLVQEWEQQSNGKWRIRNLVLVGDGSGRFARTQTLSVDGNVLVLSSVGELPRLAICDENARQVFLFDNAKGVFTANPTGIDLGEAVCTNALTSDYGNDGVTDLLLLKPNLLGRMEYHALLPTGLEPTGLIGQPLLITPPIQLDANGDGYRDVVFFNEPQCRKGISSSSCKVQPTQDVWISTSTGYEFWMALAPEGATSLPLVNNAAALLGNASRKIGDFDGDGRDDILFPSDHLFVLDGDRNTRPVTEWTTWLTRGLSLEPVSTGEFIQGYVDDTGAHRGPLVNGVGDFNGDGATDFVSVEGDRDPLAVVVHFGKRAIQHPGLVRAIAEGNGRRLELEYVDQLGAHRSHSSEAHYRPGAGCPEHRTCAPRAPVGTVAKVVEGLVLEGHGRTTTYRYADAQSARDGWLGYASELSELSGSSAGTIVRQGQFFQRKWHGLHWRHTGVALPVRAERFYQLDPGAGVANASNRSVLARLVRSSFVRRPPANLVTLLEHLESEEHSVFEEYVNAQALADSGLDGYSKYFSQAPLSSRRVSYLAPDRYGNPTGRSTTLRSVDGTSLVASELVLSRHTISAEDRRVWTVSAPSRVEWTSVVTQGDETKAQVTIVENSKGLVDRITEKLATATGNPEAPATAGATILTTQYRRDGYGNPRFVVEADPLQSLGRAREILYDERHLFPTAVAQTVRTPGHAGTSTLRTQFDIDDVTGLTLVTKDPAGLVTKVSYDGFGRPIWESRPDGTSTLTEYNMAGPLDVGSYTIRRQSGVATTVGQPPRQGPTEIVVLDGWNRVTTTRTIGYLGAPVEINVQLDEFGREVMRSAPHDLSAGGRDFVVERMFDALGRVVEEQDGRGRRRFGYPSYHVLSQDTATRLSGPNHARWGNPKITWADIVQDEEGRFHATGRDASGAPVLAVSPGLDRTLYTFGAGGVVRRIIDAESNEVTIDHDAYGRPTRVVDPDVGARTSSYYGTGELYRESLNGEAIEYTYDTLGRLRSRVRGSEASTWTWDVNGADGQTFLGRLMRTEGNGGQVAYKYLTSTGQLERSEHTILGETFRTGFEYDPYARLRQINYPSVQGAVFSVVRGYDESGLLTSLSKGDGGKLWEVTEAYRGYLPSSVTWGDGTVEKTAYDTADHQIKSVSRWTGPSIIDSTDYSYWVTGNVKAKTRNGVGESYNYDSLGRLTNVKDGVDPTAGTGVKWSVEHSAIGNITRRSDQGSYSYTHEDGVKRPHAVASTESGYLYGYDAVGRVTRRTSPDGAREEFDYNSFDLPSRITRTVAATSSETTYGYSADGQKLWSKTGSEVKYQAGPYRLIRSSGAVAKQTFSVLLGSREVVRVERLADGSESTTYLHHDRLGSVEIAIDPANGSAGISRQAYEPFGGSANTGTAFWAGHELEQGTSVVDMKGRYYDPAIGRFLTPDVFIQDPFRSESLNRYSYAWNNPVNLVDPSGFNAVDTNPNGVGSSSGSSQGGVDGYGAYRDATNLLYALQHPAGATIPITSSGGGHSGGNAAGDVLDYLDRNQLVIFNAVCDSIAGWGEAVSFGGGGWAQEQLGLSGVVNRDSASYKAGFWGGMISPGGWRSLVTNPRAVISAGAAAGQKALALTGSGLRAVLAQGAKAGARLRDRVLQGIDAVPVPGLGVGGAGGVTVGALRAAARARGAGGVAAAERQIQAAWGATRYRHGGLMNGIEHIMYRHSAGSGFTNVSRFAEGTTARNVVGYVDDALRHGAVTQTGANAFTVEHSLGRAIGTNIAGEAATSVRVFVRDGIIQTAFPF